MKTEITEYRQIEYVFETGQGLNANNSQQVDLQKNGRVLPASQNL
jgi:hypothetical protein